MLQYDSREALLAQARHYVEESHGAVSINQDAIAHISSALLSPAKLRSRDEYISPELKESYDLTRAFFELALIVAQNAGYTHNTSEGGVTKWEVQGSGSKAIVAFFRELRDQHKLPGIDLTTAESVRETIAPLLAGGLLHPDLKGRQVPFASERLELFSEFANPDGMKVFQEILAAAKTTDGYHFTFENTVIPLREHFPKSFGDDPLCKKALLVALAITTNARAHGVVVSTDVPLPADYRLPVSLSKLGVLELSDELREVINNNVMLAQNDSRLLAIRGATLLACEQCRERTGLAPEQLDEALWSFTPSAQVEPLPDSFVERILSRPPNSFGMWI